MNMWTAFLTYLLMCIGNILDLTIIYDHYHVIITSVANIMPNTQHNFCNYHIKGNIQTQFKKTKLIKRLFWRVVMAYCISDFQVAMTIISQVNPVAVTYLTDIGYERWLRAHFG